MSIFDIPVNMDDLTAAPVFQPMPSGVYTTTLTGASFKQNESGWKGIRLDFEGFTDENGKTYDRRLNVQYTIDHEDEQVVQIGADQLYKAALAFGLVEAGPDGTAKLLIAEDTPEAVAQAFDEAQGTQVSVYVKTGPRQKKVNGAYEIQYKDDEKQQPWIDSNIRSVKAL